MLRFMATKVFWKIALTVRYLSLQKLVLVWGNTKKIKKCYKKLKYPLRFELKKSRSTLKRNNNHRQIQGRVTEWPIQIFMIFATSSLVSDEIHPRGLIWYLMKVLMDHALFDRYNAHINADLWRAFSRNYVRHLTQGPKKLGRYSCWRRH